MSRVSSDIEEGSAAPAGIILIPAGAALSTDITIPRITDHFPTAFHQIAAAIDAATAENAVLIDVEDDQLADWAPLSKHVPCAVSILMDPPGDISRVWQTYRPAFESFSLDDLTPPARPLDPVQAAIATITRPATSNPARAARNGQPSSQDKREGKFVVPAGFSSSEGEDE